MTDSFTDQPPLTDIIRTTRLKYFGHIARANPSTDHSRALRASVAPLPRDWNRRAGRPRYTWLRTVESDLAPFNIGLATAYHRAQNRQAWSKLVGTATSTSGQATWWWWWLLMSSSSSRGKIIRGREGCEVHIKKIPIKGVVLIGLLSKLIRDYPCPPRRTAVLAETKRRSGFTS